MSGDDLYCDVYVYKNLVLVNFDDNPKKNLMFPDLNSFYDFYLSDPHYFYWRSFNLHLYIDFKEV